MRRETIVLGLMIGAFGWACGGGKHVDDTGASGSASFVGGAGGAAQGGAPTADGGSGGESGGTSIGGSSSAAGGSAGAQPATGAGGGGGGEDGGTSAGGSPPGPGGSAGAPAAGAGGNAGAAPIPCTDDTQCPGGACIAGVTASCHSSCTSRDQCTASTVCDETTSLSGGSVDVCVVPTNQIEGGACATDSQCGAGLDCTNHIWCSKECTADADCANGACDADRHRCTFKCTTSNMKYCALIGGTCGSVTGANGDSLTACIP